MKLSRKIVVKSCILFALLCITCLFITGCNSSKKEKIALNPEWNPSVDKSIEFYEEILEEDLSTLEMDIYNDHLQNLYDVKLYTIFYKYINKLPIEKRNSEINEQNDWLVKRKNLVETTLKEYQEGRLVNIFADKANIDFTKERIIEIKKKESSIK